MPSLVRRHAVSGQSPHAVRAPVAKDLDPGRRPRDQLLDAARVDEVTMLQLPVIWSTETNMFMYVPMGCFAANALIARRLGLPRRRCTGSPSSQPVAPPRGTPAVAWLLLCRTYTPRLGALRRSMFSLPYATTPASNFPLTAPPRPPSCHRRLARRYHRKHSQTSMYSDDHKLLDEMPAQATRSRKC